MGEYWKPVNFTRREYINPHRVNCGLKFSEWVHPHSAVFRRIDELVSQGKWGPADDLAAVSDYGGFFQLRGVPGPKPEPAGETYDDLTDALFKDVSLPDGYK